MDAQLTKVIDLLRVDGNHGQARRLAEEVLERSRTEPKLVADALYCVSRCEIIRAMGPRYKESSERRSMLSEAEKMVRMELQAVGQNRLAEAIVLLSASSLLVESKRLPQTRRGNKKRQEAKAVLERLLFTFEELSESYWEAEASLVLCSLCLSQNAPIEALRWAQRAEKLLEGHPELPRALHACAQAISLGPTSRECYEQGLKYNQKAAELYRQRGSSFQLAVQCHFWSKWCLVMSRNREALAPAKESLELLEKLPDWRQEALNQLCRVRLAMADIKGAQRLQQEALESCGQELRIRFLALETKIILNLELDTLYESGDLTAAQKAADDGLQVAKQLQDSKWEASMNHYRAQAFLRLRKLEDALEAVTASSTMLEDLGEQLQRCAVLQCAIEILMAKGDGRASVEVAQEIRRLCKDLGNRSKEAHAVLTEAQIYHSAGSHAQALSLAKEAQEIFRQVDDKKGEGMSWSIVSEIQKSVGEKDEAMRACRSTRALYQQAGDKRSQAYAMKTSTALFVATASDEEAVREANEALALARAAGDSKAEVEMLNLVAQATLNSIIKRSQEMSDEEAVQYITLHEDAAVRPAREAAAMARKMGDKQMTGIATYSVAQCHAVAGRTSAAVQAAKEATQLFHETWDRQGEAMAILMLGESLVLDGHADEGEGRAQEAKELFASIHDDEGVDKAESTIRQIREILGGPVYTPAEEAPVTQVESQALVQKKATLSMDKAIQMVKTVAAEALGDEMDITLDGPLMDLGMDSLAAISFRETLIRESGLSMASSLIFDFPTVFQIAEHLVETSER